jgi:CRISPR-associated exonuclease Cas4
MGSLSDEQNRLRVLTDLGSSLLVEAGAGTGKTALLAGRLVMLLATGVKPKSIAAITFTELAASELSVRINDYVTQLLEGRYRQNSRLPSRRE